MIVAATNRDIREVAEETPFEFPLQLSKKRTAFTEQIHDLHLMAAEWDQVHTIVKRSRKNVRAAAQFRLVLRKNLERWASEENLQPAPRDRFDKLLKDYHRRTLPSKIANDYVGCRRSTSGAVIKKLLVIARDPERMASSLFKYFKKSYRPKNLDAILQSFAT